MTATHNYFGVYEDAEATLECIVEAYPLPVNNWIKGSKILKAYDDGSSAGSNVTSYIVGSGSTNVFSSSMFVGGGSGTGTGHSSSGTDHDEMISLR